MVVFQTLQRIHILLYICVYIYIYIYVEREKERDNIYIYIYKSLSFSHIHIYIYIWCLAKNRYRLPFKKKHHHPKRGISEVGCGGAAVRRRRADEPAGRGRPAVPPGPSAEAGGVERHLGVDRGLRQGTRAPAGALSTERRLYDRAVCCAAVLTGAVRIRRTPQSTTASCS